MSLPPPRRGWPVLLLVLLALPALPVPAAESPAAEIRWLMDHVAESGLVFLRNGEEHDASEAAAHMARKYRYFEDEIESAEAFIARAASRSLLSDRPYLVVLPDGSRRPTADWLREALARHRLDVAGEVHRAEGRS